MWLFCVVTGWCFSGYVNCVTEGSSFLCVIVGLEWTIWLGSEIVVKRCILARVIEIFWSL